MSKNNESFLSSIFKFSISTWVNFIIGFFSSFISTRIVSPDIYGLFNIFNTCNNSYVHNHVRVR